MDINSLPKSKFGTPVFKMDNTNQMQQVAQLTFQEARRRGRLVCIEYTDQKGITTKRWIYPFSPILENERGFNVRAICLLRWEEQGGPGNQRFDPKRWFYLDSISQFCVGPEAPIEVVQYAQKACSNAWLDLKH